MNVLADALKKAGISVSDFKDEEIDEKKIKRELWIEFLEKYLHMHENYASEKELHSFVTDHGFLSQKHLNLYLACRDDVDRLRDEIEELKDCLPSNKVMKMEKDLAEKEWMSEHIRDKRYYKNIMRRMKQTDVSPYGVDLLKF